MLKSHSTVPLRIAFAGTPDFSASSLAALISSDQMGSEYELIAVYTQPDRPAGRGRKIQQSAVKTLAIENNIPLLQPFSFKDEKTLNELTSLQLDLLVVVAYGQILPEAALETPLLGCINVHASLLPRWRGAAPIQRAIAAGDQKTGVTIMQMNAGLDTGPMLLSSNCNIEQNDTAQILHDKLASLGAQTLLKSLPFIARGTLSGQDQDETQVTYAEKISKAEAKIDWQETAETIHRKIRAFNPIPVAHTYIFEKNVRIWEAELVEESKTTLNQPGNVLAIHRNGIDIGTDQGIIRIKTLQLPGKKKVSVTDFLNGNPELLTSTG